MPPASACPELADYKRLVTGPVPPARREALLGHLEACSACKQRIGALPAEDTLFSLLDEDTLPGTPADQKVARLIARLRGAAPAAPATFQARCPACGKAMRVPQTSAGKRVQCP